LRQKFSQASLPILFSAVGGIFVPFRLCHFSACFLVLTFSTCLAAQGVSSGDPQAVTYAAQSIAALTGGTQITDATLTGSVTWNAGTDTGTATLRALGVNESRMDLPLTSGTHRKLSCIQAIGNWGR
jgi:hypothetical protein